jgi:hypothetical protein
MKKITEKTILKQGDKEFQPVEADGIIYWVGKEGFAIASSKLMTDDIPVISLDSYVKRLAESKYELQSKAFENSTEMFPFNDSELLKAGFIDGYKSNPNQYTQKDIEKAIDLAREEDGFEFTLTKEKILQQINSISVIEVDEQFNIISYE